MGLGSRLIELAKPPRPAGLQLWTFVTNTGAQRFYRHHGFVVAETTDGSRNEEKAPDIRFSGWLSASSMSHTSRSGITTVLIHACRPCGRGATSVAFVRNA